MTTDAIAGTSPATPTAPRRVRFDHRYLAPALITCVLLAGQLSFGFLESWSRTFLAIATAIIVELVVTRVLYGKWPHLASAYISGISVGILVRSPAFWPYALCSAISIVSKYVLRVDGRHIWNPTNFGVVAMLVLAPDTVAGLSVQWGNTLLPMVIVWMFGTVILWMVGRIHITLVYVASFVLFAALRAQLTGHPFLSEVAPITGPMYQLFIFFMITDPKTTAGPKWAQSLVAFLVAAVEAIFRLLEFVHAPFYALFVVGPAANLIEIALTKRRAARAAPAAVTASAQSPQGSQRL
jgi:enediyne biosynthesis protein E5